MILWIILFILVLAISFILALKSMRDYQEIPSKSGKDFGLFLIRNSQALNEHFFNSLHADLLQSGLNISIERLFKGQESAVVLYGSSELLDKYKQPLNLLELEDYTNIEADKAVAWEIGIKNGPLTSDNGQKIFENLPELSQTEQSWWQIIVWVEKGDTNFFRAHIRTVIYGDDQLRKKDLTQKIQNLSLDKFVKLPKAYSNTQVVDFYKNRSFPKLSENQKLSGQEIIRLISLA